MGSSSKMNDKFKAAMMNEFEMKDLGIMKYFLGMEVYQSKDEIFICHMLNKFDMLDCHPSLLQVLMERCYVEMMVLI